MPDPHVIEPVAAARLLLIDGTPRLSAELARPLAEQFAVEPVVVETRAGRHALDLLRGTSFDIVAADLNALVDLAESVDDRIGKLARAAAGALLLVLSDDESISVALAAMRAGAHDCVGKSVGGAALIERIDLLARRHGKVRAMTRQMAAANETAASMTEVPAEPSIPVMRDLVLPMWRQEQRIIETAIQSFAGNIALAAAALELSPSTIYRKRQAWAELDSRRAQLAAVSAR